MQHGDGTHYMVINQTIREAIRLNKMNIKNGS